MGLGLRFVALTTTALCATAPARAERETTETILPTLEEAPDSISCGSTNRGALSDSVPLPASGSGYIIPEPWLSRQYNHGTRELVSLIQRAAGAVDRSHPGGLLGVGDLSGEGGGALPGHRSHQSGRDVDLIYYALDEGGAPFEPDQHMAYFRSDGQANYAKAPDFVKGIPIRYFDLARNWSLIRALMDDPYVDVSHIFVSTRVRRWLLRYAEQLGEPEETLRRARLVLRRPRDSKSHNDHMHVRVGCSEDDIAMGRCKEEQARRRGRSKWRRRVPCPRPAIADASE